MKTETAIVIGAITVTAIVGGVYLLNKSKGAPTPSPTPSPSGVNSLLLSGPTSATVNTPVTYTVVAYDVNNNPVPNIPVTLVDLTTNISSQATTDTTGMAIFSVTFSSPGTYTLQAYCC
jgi:hypothetical protein